MSFGRAKDDKELEKAPAFGQFSVTQNTKPDAFLGKGCKIVGNLFFAGSVEIDCCVEGDINGERINIGEQATLTAKISAAEIVIKGQVVGDIVASRRISLKRPAKVLGNVTAPAVSIEEGVTFEGRCVMGHPATSSVAQGASQQVTAGRSLTEVRAADGRQVDSRQAGIMSIVSDKDKVA